MGCLGCGENPHGGDCMKPIILKLARDDLKEIYERLTEYGNTPPQKFRDAFEAFCDNITTLPFMYPKYDHNTKYHKAVIEYDYLVFYQVEATNNEDRAKIYRVLHGKRDIAPLLDSEIE